MGEETDFEGKRGGCENAEGGDERGLELEKMFRWRHEEDREMTGEVPFGMARQRKEG